MAVKATNERMFITLSKSQAKWIRTNAKKLGMTTSKFIKFLMDKNLGKFMSLLPQAELDELIRIAKTPWIDLDDDLYDL